jgi:hypothetical protein
MSTILALMAIVAVIAVLVAWARSMRRRERAGWITEDAWQAMRRRGRGLP